MSAIPDPLVPRYPRLGVSTPVASRHLHPKRKSNLVASSEIPHLRNETYLVLLCQPCAFIHVTVHRICRFIGFAEEPIGVRRLSILHVRAWKRGHLLKVAVARAS